MTYYILLLLMIIEPYCRLLLVCAVGDVLPVSELPLRNDSSALPLKLKSSCLGKNRQNLDLVPLRSLLLVYEALSNSQFATSRPPRLQESDMLEAC